MNDRIRSMIKAGVFIPAHPLALDMNRQFDETKQRAVTRYYLEAGVGGIAIAVHTTQFSIREPRYNLYERVLAVAVDEINRYEEETGKSIVKVAGVCGKVDQAVREAEIAQRLGFDAVLLSPSGLQDLTERECLDRAAAVGNVSPFFGFSLQPSAGGRRFSFEFWAELCKNDNMVAIKAAPFNRYQTLDIVRAVAMSARADDIALYTGNDDNIVLDLLTPYTFTENGKTYSKRFVGGLLGHWAVWTKASVEMFAMVRKAALTGNISPALLELAVQVTDANAVVFDAANGFAGCIPGIHEVLRRQGILDNILCLDENEVLSPGQAEEIDRVCRMYPYLVSDEFSDYWRSKE